MNPQDVELSLRISIISLFSFCFPLFSPIFRASFTMHLFLQTLPPLTVKERPLKGWPCTAHQLLYLCGAWHIEGGAQLSQLSEHVM